MRITKTVVAKNVAEIGIGTASIYTMEKMLDDHTDVDTDALRTRIGVALASSFVVAKVSPVTDIAIDIVAARWHARKERKQNKTEVVAES